MNLAFTVLQTAMLYRRVHDWHSFPQNQKRVTHWSNIVQSQRKEVQPSSFHRCSSSGYTLKLILKLANIFCRCVWKTNILRFGSLLGSDVKSHHIVRNGRSPISHCKRIMGKKWHHSEHVTSQNAPPNVHREIGAKFVYSAERFSKSVL